MKILYVTTISNTVNAFLIPHIKMLIEAGHQVDVAFKIEQDVKMELIEMGCKVYELPLQRSPLRRENAEAYKLVKKIIITEGYNIVHTHTPVASTVVRIACRNLSDVKIFYTAHGFHFYKGAPLINWLIYYPIERWLSKYSDIIITINKEDYERAKDFKAKKVVYLPGIGIDLNQFKTVIIEKKIKLNSLNLPQNSFVVLSIGELNNNKNHEVVIKAIKKLENPIIQYVICGQGNLQKYLETLSKKLGLENQVHFLGFRKDIAEICKSSDIFAFPSYREGLPVSVMEAMAVGLPIIASDIRGNRDLIENGKGGYLLEPQNEEQFAECISKLFKDEMLREQFEEYNQKKIDEFSLNHVLEKMKELYFY